MAQELRVTAVLPKDMSSVPVPKWPLMAEGNSTTSTDIKDKPGSSLNPKPNQKTNCRNRTITVLSPNSNQNPIFHYNLRNKKVSLALKLTTGTVITLPQTLILTLNLPYTDLDPNPQ